jgi:hypothetical protein
MAELEVKLTAAQLSNPLEFEYVSDRGGVRMGVKVSSEGDYMQLSYYKKQGNKSKKAVLTHRGYIRLGSAPNFARMAHDLGKGIRRGEVGTNVGQMPVRSYVYEYDDKNNAAIFGDYIASLEQFYFKEMDMMTLLPLVITHANVACIGAIPSIELEHFAELVYVTYLRAVAYTQGNELPNLEQMVEETGIVH